jgi:hypothetical protein
LNWLGEIDLRGLMGGIGSCVRLRARRFNAENARRPVREPPVPAAIVFSEIELPPTGVDWKTAMRRRAISTREVLNRHRWVVGLMESRRTPGPASFRLHNAVLGYLREGGFSIEMTIQAYSVLDAYIYGFALQEKSVPFASAEESAGVAEEQAWQFAELAEERQTAALAEEFPYLAEVVGGHVAKVGYDFATAFEYGLDLILDAFEQRRDTAGTVRRRARRAPRR